MKDKDAFVFEDENSILLLLYMKLEPYQLQKALPISYMDDKDKCYLSCILDSDGRDYIGQQSLKDIEKVILNVNKCMNINHDYETIKTVFPNITYELLDKYKHFVEKQMNKSSQPSRRMTHIALIGTVLCIVCVVVLSQCK